VSFLTLSVKSPKPPSFDALDSSAPVTGETSRGVSAAWIGAANAKSISAANRLVKPLFLIVNPPPKFLEIFGIAAARLVHTKYTTNRLRLQAFSAKKFIMLATLWRGAKKRRGCGVFFRLTSKKA
jgi:hypothetical protein